MTVVLSVEDHFQLLRPPVWARFRGRVTADQFDDLWAEFWAREVEREAAGRPSHVTAPIAYVTESIQRLLVDEARARARGLARDRKGALEIEALEDQVVMAGSTTADDARYEAVVHRVLDIVRDRLTARELRVFVASFLYGMPTPAAAAALGLSEPRVKKDRVRVLAKCGEAVWPVISAELECGHAGGDFAAGLEVMADHVEDCPSCAGLRRGALSVLGPVELLAAGGAFDALSGRLIDAVHRVTDFVATVPPAGRTAALAGVAAAALAGGAVVTATPADRHDPPVVRAIRAVPAPTPAAIVRAPRVVDVVQQPVVRRPARRRRRAASSAAVARPAPRAPPVAAAPSPPASAGEFGFERD